MQITGENRTIVSRGLATLDRSDFIGLHALLREAGLSDKAVTSVLIGASKPSQILDNIKAAENTSFTAEELAKIEEISV